MLKRTERRHRGTPRRGFTLIELMVVIVVIAILVGLLMPAIFGVQQKTRIAQVRSEISSLEAAVATFKSQYGMEPPSSITLYETATGWSGDTTGSRAILRQIWPQFDFSYSTYTSNQVDLNGDGTYGSISLSLGECMVFFLGGMPTTSVSSGKTSFFMSGFTKSPTTPLSPVSIVALGPNRSTAIFDFISARLVDVNSNGFPEYVDPLPSQNMPYLYYSSYDGNGYKVGEFGGGGLNEPYRQATSNSAPAWKPKNFQIISPGFDKKYGIGGAYVATGSDHLPFDATQYPNTYTSVVPTGTLRSPESDNITNFASNALGG